MKHILPISFIFLLFSCASDRPTPCECLELANSLITKMAAGDMTEEEANAQAAACSYMDDFTEQELAEKLENCAYEDLDDAANEGMKEGLEESLSKDACACMDRIAALQSKFSTIDTTDVVAIEAQLAEIEKAQADCAWLDAMTIEDLKALFYKECPEYLSELE